MLKKCKVVMLPTNEKAQLYITDTLYYYNKGVEREPLNCTNQHLYFLSDEEIKDPTKDQLQTGLLFHFYNKPVEQGFITHVLVKGIGSYREIIATTDRLPLNDCSTPWTLEHKYVPQPSQSFLEVFVREYNKSNVIKEVLIEYEDGEEGWTGSDADGEPDWIENSILKINPKDNTITIKRVKDSLTIKELKKLFDGYGENSAAQIIWKDIQNL